ncbi:MAG: Mur ligase family protein [Bacteroidota bacterium]|nr:Mur ligase family protein [Bacteroidota bacterium]
MNYRETENWILNRLPFYQSQGLKAYKPGIDNIRFFVDHLDLNLLDIKFIHVGGTNGKGSTCAYLSSIIQESGYKVGLFTSPHFFDFRERIKVNNKKIEKDFITKFIQENIELIEELNLSFFELSFGMSLYYYFEQKVDYAVVEVGLGGRLDATNIINPILSVITNISYDHTEILGNSLEKIAYEKAGIIKKNTKIIIGERDKKTQNIFIQKADENFSDIIFASDYKTDFENSEIEYQNKNIRTAVQVSKNLNDQNINETSIKKGIMNLDSNTDFYGRWTIINYNPKVIFDSAHNESGFSYLSQQLEKLNYDRLFIILSFVKGKDVKKLITYLPKKSLIYFTSSNTERSMNYEDIIQCVKENINFDKNPMKVYKEVLKQSSSKDLIIITGSNYIAKEIFYE